MNYALRQHKLAAELKRAGVEALLVTHAPNIRYLCGFTGSSGALLVQAGESGPKSVFCTDGRYIQQAAEEVQNAKVVISKKPALIEACIRAQRAKIRKLGFEAEHISVNAQRRLADLLKEKIRLRPVSNPTEVLREIKDPEEIEQMKAAAALGVGLFRSALSIIRPGISEAVIAGQLELQARAAGAEKMSFDTI